MQSLSKMKQRKKCGTNGFTCAYDCGLSNSFTATLSLSYLDCLFFNGFWADIVGAGGNAYLFQESECSPACTHNSRYHSSQFRVH